MILKPRDVAVILGCVTAVAIAVVLGHYVLPTVPWGIPVCVAVAVCVGATLEAYRRAQSTAIDMHNLPGNNFRQLEALLSLHAALRLEEPLPAMRGAAISPDFALSIVSLIRQGSPMSIFEAGSGVSTLVIGHCLKAAGRGHLLSLDHDAGYAAQTRARVNAHGLDGFVTVVHAGLKPTTVHGASYSWYDQNAFTLPNSIDLLVVDGPVQQGVTERHVRYPALPLLFPALSNRCAVLVDDCDRADEQEVVARWLQEFNVFEIERTPGEKKHFILRRRLSA